MIKKLRNNVYSFLRWSERYTKTDMIYLTKGSFWITLGQVVSNILSLLLIIAFANLLPKETYGIYKYILSLAGILNIFTLTGMNNAVAQAVSKGEEGALRISVSYQIKWNLLMLCAFLILGSYYFIQGDTILAISFLILGIFVPTTLALNTYGSYLEGRREFKIAGISNIVSVLVYSIGIFLAIVLSGEILWIVIAYAFTTFLSTLAFYLFILRRFKPQAHSEAIETIRYGRHLTFIGFIGPIASQIDKIIVAHFWGAAQLAVYSLALAIPDRAVPLIKNWIAVGFPKFANKTPEELNETFYSRVLQGVLLGSLATLAYILIAPPIFTYLIPQYLDSVFYSQILSVSFIFAIPNRYISLLLVSQKFTRPIFLNSIAQNVTRILLYIILGIFSGILGLVLANVVMAGASMFLNIFVWRHSSKKT